MFDFSVSTLHLEADYSLIRETLLVRRQLDHNQPTPKLLDILEKLQSVQDRLDALFTSLPPVLYTDWESDTVHQVMKANIHTTRAIIRMLLM